MAGNIQLTPAELLSQASGMRNIYEQYTSLFGNVENLLTVINENWSPNLANNFVSKITSAQNGFRTILNLIEGGINAAENAANAFESVDSSLAQYFAGAAKELLNQSGLGGVVEGVIKDSGFDITNLSTLTPQMYEKFVEVCKSGDLSAVTDILMPGFTDEMKDKAAEVIKNKTGLTIDPDKLIESVRKGDYSGALLDIAEASNDIGTSVSGYSAEGIAIDFLIETTRTSLDSNGFAQNHTDVYSNRMLDAWDEKDLGGLLGAGFDYMLDVPGRVILNAAGDTTAKIVDDVAKNTIGISVSEANEKIEEMVGVNPGKVVHNIGSAIGDAYHGAISEGGIGDAVGGLVSSAFKTGGKFLSNLGSGIKKAF